MALKRANGEGNLRKRSNGTWEARVTLGTDPKTGKLISKSVYARTQKECREKMKALLGIDGGQAATPPAAPKEPPKPRPEDVITVGQWLDTWLKEYLADVKQGTSIHYESVVRLHLKPALGDIPLSQLRTPMMQKFYNKLRAEQRSPKYIKNIHGVLHRALDMAVRVEYLERNPTSACILPKVVEKQVTPLDAPEQKRLFIALKGNPFEALFLTAAFTGMRVGEIIGLTWDCVDFEHGVIHIEKQLVQTRVKGQDYVFGTLKNGKTRVIAPAPFVMEVLKKHKADQEAQKREMGDLWNEGKFPGLVFNHPDGRHYSQPTIWKEFQNILAAAGLEHHRVHDLRHTFAVNSIMAGDDIKTLQENMGHYSAAFTLDRYGHVTETMRRESSNRMQAFIEKMA
jgi:integrase